MIIEKIKNSEAKIGVIGLGYVGLPLILSFVKKGFSTMGFDIDESKVSALNAGQSYIEHIDSDEVTEAAKSGLLEATSDFSKIADVDAIIICVPTPLSIHWEPDLSYIHKTMDAILPALREGQVICLESTTYPGTTDEEILPRLVAKGLVPGENFSLVFSPEREDPGNKKYAGPTIPKVLGGVTPSCLADGKALYEAIYASVVPVSSTKVAEFTKLLENIFRAVNIGLVNEMKIVAQAMNVDIWEVIEAASSKPFGFTPFYPGPGLGGHCIPIDPFYLTWKAREFGIHTRFIELAGEINRSMPQYVVDRIVERLNKAGKAVKGSRILLLGLAYKSNVDDMRESPTFALLDLLATRGAILDYYDPHVPVIGPTREHAEWEGKKSIEWTKENLSSYDMAVISTDHDAVNIDELVAWVDLIVDTRNAVARSGLSLPDGQLWKA
jgi:UDP-N-acetyl-D-glucosamine dehydrogenase